MRLPIVVTRTPRYDCLMIDRVKVTEAVRRTGEPGTEIFLAVRSGKIASERDERGYDWVDPDEAATLALQR